MPKIYLSMSCCGKSYYKRHTPGCRDIHVFHIPKPWMIGKLTGDADKIIVINPFENFEKVFKDNGIQIDVIIMPVPNMKAEILERAIEKDTDERDNWPAVYADLYDSLWQELENSPYPRVYLEPGHYVSDVLDENGDIKEGVQVITPNKEQTSEN